MALNEAGARGKYKYVMDDGTVIKLRLDATYGSLTQTGLTALVTTDNAINKPSNFKPRVVFWQSSEAQANGKLARRTFVCDTDSPAYTSVDNFAMTVDGVAGQTTGRRGEQISF